MTMTKRNGEVVAEEQFLEEFDNGADMREYFDFDKGTVKEPGDEPFIVRVDPPKRVNVDFPDWMVEELDAEAKRLAIPRQAVIKILIDEGLRRRRNQDA